MHTYVSITGADDNTDVERLRSLTQRYSSVVQWGLLYFPEKEGTARNPTAAKRTEIINAVGEGWVAAHLCGEQVFRDILAEKEDVIHDLRRYSELQININARKPIFTDEEILKVYRVLIDAEYRIIVQYHDQSANLIDNWLSSLSAYDFGQVTVLFDGSKGKGVTPTSWPISKLYVDNRWAGGLDEHNIVDARTSIIESHLKKNIRLYDIHLDLESGARTNNEFDLDKCDRILETISK